MIPKKITDYKVLKGNHISDDELDVILARIVAKIDPATAKIGVIYTDTLKGVKLSVTIRKVDKKKKLVTLHVDITRNTYEKISLNLNY